MENATLDLTEPRRLSFKAAGAYALDVSVNRHDVRESMFDINGARCEWIMSERRLVIQIPLLPLPSYLASQ